MAKKSKKSNNFYRYIIKVQKSNFFSKTLNIYLRNFAEVLYINPRNLNFSRGILYINPINEIIFRRHVILIQEIELFFKDTLLNQEIDFIFYKGTLYYFRKSIFFLLLQLCSFWALSLFF